MVFITKLVEDFWVFDKLHPADGTPNDDGEENEEDPLCDDEAAIFLDQYGNEIKNFYKPDKKQQYRVKTPISN